jgi:hypothetical protein
MAGVANLPEPITMSKEMGLHAEGVHVEKVTDHEQLVDRLNNLDPPVTPEEERRVRRKIDLRLPPFLLVLYIFTWLDRGALGKNIAASGIESSADQCPGNAALMDIKTDLNISGPQFSLAVSMFFVGTCVADLFTNIGMRYIRPSLYLAGAMVRQEIPYM